MKILIKLVIYEASSDELASIRLLTNLKELHLYNPRADDFSSLHTMKNLELLEIVYYDAGGSNYSGDAEGSYSHGITDGQAQALIDALPNCGVIAYEMVY